MAEWAGIWGLPQAKQLLHFARFLLFAAEVKPVESVALGWAGQGWECPARGPSWCWVEAALEEVLEAQGSGLMAATVFWFVGWLLVRRERSRNGNLIFYRCLFLECPFL